MVHPNAPLSPEGRFRLVRLVVADGWPVAGAAERFQVSRTTASRWLGRYQQLGGPGWSIGQAGPIGCPGSPGPGGPQDRAPADHPPVGAGPDRGSAGPGCLHRPSGPGPGRPQPAGLDRPGQRPASAPHQHPAPGCLVHVDINKLGNIPQGGGHRVHGRQRGKHHGQADKAPVGAHSRHPRHGSGYVHAAVETTPGWPMWRSSLMSRPPPRVGSGSGRMPGPPSVGSPSSGC